MKKIILLSIIYLLFLISFASAQNRIFSGEFNDTYFDVTSITPSHESVEAYAEGNSSQFYVSFHPSNERYYVNEENIYLKEGINYFYFIANVPENAQKIKFYYNNSLLRTLNTNSDFQISNFNITYNNSFVNSSWQSDLDNYYVSIYYNESGLWNPLFFEAPFNNSYEVDMPLGWFYFSGYHKFKLIISNGFSEKESYFWFNIPYISWCNGADTNKDSVIDSSDYLTVKMNFGRTGCNDSNNWCNGADINQNNQVDWDDWQILLSEFGSSNCSQAIFPEIPAQLLAEAAAEKLAASEASSSGSSSSNSSNRGSITSNIVKNDNANSNNKKTPAKESKLSNLTKSSTKIIAKTVETIKKAVSSIFYNTKKQ